MGHHETGVRGMSTSAGLLRRGGALYRRGEHVRALDIYLRYLDAHPRGVAGWVGVARTLYVMHEVDGALAACDCVLAFEPHHRAALTLRERIGADERMRPAMPARQPPDLPLETFELVPALVHLIAALFHGGV
jgi:hypothetical protein